MTQRIKLSGAPWVRIIGQTYGEHGPRMICEVRCMTRDGRYFLKPMVDLYEPREWCEKVGLFGSINPEHWQFEAIDETPRGHSFRDLADHAELEAAGY